MAFLTFYNSINGWLFFQSKCLFSIDVHNRVIQISKIRTTVVLMGSLLFEIFAIFYGNLDPNFLDDAYCKTNVCVNCTSFVIYSMIHSEVILTILSFLIRKEQMRLLQRIAEFDECVNSSLNSSINVNHWKRRFIYFYSIFGIHNGVLFFGYRILDDEIEDKFWMASFCYAMADLSFTAVIMNMCFYGYFFNHRYGALIKRLKVIVRHNSHINRKHFTEISTLYFRLFDLQLKFSRIFGLILAFTFLTHWISHTTAIYLSIYSIEIDPEKSLIFLSQMIISLFPYALRIGFIVTIFAPIGQQVLKALESFE